MAENENNKESGGFKVTDCRRSEPEPEPEAPKVEPSRVEPAREGGKAPPLDFSTFILSLASTALIQLGAAPNPETKETEADPDLARQTIDLLGMLREKTRGNLTEDESRFFDAMLYDLRIRFVEVTRGRA